MNIHLATILVLDEGMWANVGEVTAILLRCVICCRDVRLGGIQQGGSSDGHVLDDSRLHQPEQFV